MGKKFTQGLTAGGLFGLGGIEGNRKGGLLKGAPDMPEPEPLPAEVEEVDVESTLDYSKSRAKRRRGRSKTILGSTNAGKKTVLG